MRRPEGGQEFRIQAARRTQSSNEFLHSGWFGFAGFTVSSKMLWELTDPEFQFSSTSWKSAWRSFAHAQRSGGNSNNKIVKLLVLQPAVVTLKTCAAIISGSVFAADVKEAAPTGDQTPLCLDAGRVWLGQLYQCDQCNIVACTPFGLGSYYIRQCQRPETRVLRRFLAARLGPQYSILVQHSVHYHYQRWRS